MNRMSMALVLLPLIAGCGSTTVTPSFDYAATSLGVYNSGLLNVGQLFVWDTKKNTLTRLDEIPFPTEPGSKTQPTTLFASNISSISFNAGLDAAVKASASAAIRDNVSIQVQNGSREEYRSTITLISNEIVRKRSAGEDVDRNWLLKQATQKGSKLVYILVRGVVISDKAELVTKKTASGKLELTLPSKKGGNTTVDLSKESFASCTGAKSPCFLSFQVLRPYINDRGNYDFEPVSGVSNTRIGDLLKTL